MSDKTTDARQGLDDLLERRARADARIEEVEREQRKAVAAAQATSSMLTELERRALAGEKVTASERRRVEEALATAQARAAEPWHERREAAISFRRQAHAELQQHAAAHLRDLVPDVERRGEEAAQDMLAAAAAFMGAYRRREGIALELGELVAMTGARIHPSDVGPPSSATVAAHELEALLTRGEQGPTLRRYPGEAPRRVAIAESIA